MILLFGLSAGAAPFEEAVFFLGQVGRQRVIVYDRHFHDSGRKTMISGACGRSSNTPTLNMHSNCNHGESTAGQPRSLLTRLLAISREPERFPGEMLWCFGSHCLHISRKRSSVDRLAPPQVPYP